MSEPLWYAHCDTPSEYFHTLSSFPYSIHILLPLVERGTQTNSGTHDV